MPGQLFFLYLMLAGAARFMVEFLRVNPRVFMGLSEAQLIAIIMMILGAGLYVYSSSDQVKHARTFAAQSRSGR